MKVVFYAPNFHPMIGGVENIVKGLATALTGLGHSVRVLTLAKQTEPDQFPFAVVRDATSLKSIRHIWWADIVVHVNLSLKGVLPLLAIRRPLVDYHNGLYPTTTIAGQLKWLVTRTMSVNVGCSPYISGLYSCKHTIPNPYNDALFQRLDGVAQTGELLFVGRLVSEKGVDVLIRALHQLKLAHGSTPLLTIVGDGPERPSLLALSVELGVDRQLIFEGPQTGETVVRAMNRHSILVVPSNYNEPFGAVAVEGIACGCFVISSDGGGLPDTVGSCGITFEKGNHLALADALWLALCNSAWRETHQLEAHAHLRRHTLSAVTDQFLHVFTEEING